jgi:hypothetical protein
VIISPNTVSCDILGRDNVICNKEAFKVTTLSPFLSSSSSFFSLVSLISAIYKADYSAFCMCYYNSDIYLKRDKEI